MKIVTAMFTAALLITAVSCNQKEKELTPKEIKFKTDSTVATRVDELKRAAAEDLDRRMSIEVKGKRDSIVEAYIQSQNPVAPQQQTAPGPQSATPAATPPLSAPPAPAQQQKPRVPQHTQIHGEQ